MNQMSSAAMGTLTEQDLFHNILVLLKHNVREYATAVTEANCPVVRQTMQRMLHETLAEQADCYQVMGRQGWYPPGPAANRQDVQKSIQQHRQSATQTAQSLQAAGIRPVLRQGMTQNQSTWQTPAPSGQWQNQPPAAGNQWNTGNQSSHQWQTPGSQQNSAQYGQPQYQPVMHAGSYTSATSGTGAVSSVLDAAGAQSAVDPDAWRSTGRTGRGEMTH